MLFLKLTGGWHCSNWILIGANGCVRISRVERCQSRLSVEGHTSASQEEQNIFLCPEVDDKAQTCFWNRQLKSSGVKGEPDCTQMCTAGWKWRGASVTLTSLPCGSKQRAVDPKAELWGPELHRAVLAQLQQKSACTLGSSAAPSRKDRLALCCFQSKSVVLLKLLIWVIGSPLGGRQGFLELP